MVEPAQEDKVEGLVQHIGTAAPSVRPEQHEFKPPSSHAKAERLIRSVGTAVPRIRFLDDEPIRDPDDPEFRIPGSFEAHLNEKKHKTEEEIANYHSVVRKNTNAV